MSAEYIDSPALPAGRGWSYSPTEGRSSQGLQEKLSASSRDGSLAPSHGQDRDEQVDDLVDLPSILDFLTRQRVAHVAQQQEAWRRSQKRPVRKPRGPPLSHLPWKRPLGGCEQFSQPGILPALYLEPREASNVDRPEKTYTRHEGPAFLPTLATPRVFDGELSPLQSVEVSILSEDSTLGGASVLSSARTPRLRDAGASVASTLASPRSEASVRSLQAPWVPSGQAKEKALSRRGWVLGNRSDAVPPISARSLEVSSHKK
mmetsp:Transcript_67227/g.161090  ORF Transcript_67227/g.161090 Transcript_67227/m.161090 type:complete len:261 (-) Transcript_67227:111-893(-)|eukprot:CAMPEP_0178430096 /NCGR_PEP_ID=MMETSP0689_2-20121128/31141_1 /TAXON_ID=160604 /ORGANISM="Amphidinium massartii, Strain CS-259" /LENGTH=260 /DNA_ID=CAMNT_0020051937 /DNA_START=9 /DNA_END=791 /DNA_ORIENTATION=+